ncbi:MAG: Hpt domain-containing protein [Clostridia bacterium]|nr:Hpt domain-containing protein [Clostridia bacterium]
MITLDSLKAYGANVEEGLHRCMNMEAFYLKLFDSLKGDTRVDDLQAALAEKNLDKAFEIAHALKGIYGNLSLTPLYEPVQEITELLRARTDTDYGPLMAQILEQKQKLDALL